MVDCWPPDFRNGATPDTDPPAFPSGREGTKQIIPGGNIWPSESEPLPQGNKPLLSQRVNTRRSRTFVAFPGRGSARAMPAGGDCSSRTACALYASCAGVTKQVNESLNCLNYTNGLSPLIRKKSFSLQSRGEPNGALIRSGSVLMPPN